MCNEAVFPRSYALWLRVFAVPSLCDVKWYPWVGSVLAAAKSKGGACL